MDHILFSLFFGSSTYILLYFGIDGISFILQLVLLLYLQYKFFVLTIDDTPRYDHFQHCVSCKKLTPQHYVHCTKCKKCVPVLYSHYDSIGFCAKKKSFRVYVAIKRIIIVEQIIVSFVMSFHTPYLLMLGALYVYVMYWSCTREMV